MPDRLRVLHLEDDVHDAEIVQHRLHSDGLACDILLTQNQQDFEAALRREPFDLIISDYNLPGYDGVRALIFALGAQPEVPVILISGTVGEEQGVKCLHLGATDYLLKGQLERLVPAVERAIREASARQARLETARALAEQGRALRENEERTTFALGAARMGVWEIDFDDHRLTWSDTMAPLFGLTSAQAPSTSEAFFDLIHPEDRPEAEASIARAIAGERDYAIEFRAVWPDGSAHWVLGRAQATYDESGKPLRLLGVGMDIDERKQLEGQLRQAQKLEAIGQLAGGVAHDFNNVLTVILGFSGMLLDGLSPDDPVRVDLREIKVAGERAAGLTRQLLAFSRNQVLKPQVLDIDVLIDGIKPMLRQLLPEHVELVVEHTLPSALVKMDPTQVEQLLVNLAVNAADAMPRGGHLTLRTSSVTLDEQYQHRHLPVPPGGYILLAVSDTGTGMSAATRRRVFEPFFTTKDVGKGTGLGLATVYGIVKQSGGDIAIESAPGQGTTFNIILPQILESGGSAGTADRASGDHGAVVCSETVLLVEDDAGVRHLAQLALEREGYQVLLAGSPREALQVATQCPDRIDLLLSDVIMPDSAGPPLIERLLPERPALRVLYMSGYADEAIRQVLMLEDSAFLQKPFTTQALTRRVREVLDAV